MAERLLIKAKKEKNDEFYTQWADIEKEVNAYLEFDPNVFRGKTVFCPCDDPEWSNFTKYFALNFETLGIKKFISTSYAPNSKPKEIPYQLTMFETGDPKFDKNKTKTNGKIFVLEKSDTNKDKQINIDNLKWDYLEGDGDFRSDEIRKLRDEADIIITNPPFSLFREFIAWIINANKRFLIIGNINALTYREIFPLVRDNKIWLGPSITSGDRAFNVPDNYPLDAAGCGVDVAGRKYIRVKWVRWFTNIDHGRRHQPLALMTMSDNLKFNKRLKGANNYQKYDNYNAIEVPFTDAIPSDFDGVMGVPITFLDKYNPDQFEIIGLGISNSGIEIGVKPYKPEHKKYRKEVQKRGAVDGDLYFMVDGVVEVPYARILVKHKRSEK